MQKIKMVIGINCDHYFMRLYNDDRRIIDPLFRHLSQMSVRQKCEMKETKCSIRGSFV